MNFNGNNKQSTEHTHTLAHTVCVSKFGPRISIISSYHSGRLTFFFSYNGTTGYAQLVSASSDGPLSVVFMKCHNKLPYRISTIDVYLCVCVSMTAYIDQNLMHINRIRRCRAHDHASMDSNKCIISIIVMFSLNFQQNINEYTHRLGKIWRIFFDGLANNKWIKFTFCALVFEFSDVRDV